MGDILAKKNLLLRKATWGDSDDIFLWRNDEITRKNSFNSKYIPFEEHKKWFKKALRDPDKCILMGLIDEKKLGVVRFDSKGSNVVEVSINLSPDKRGLGFGSQLLKIAINYFLDNSPSSKLITKIKKYNIASIKSFEKIGFSYKESFNDGVILELSHRRRLLT